jgi:2-phospho-L-lactate guanylyltransferase
VSGTWAVLPVKPLRGALRRLTPALDAPVRRALQVAMLTDVLDAVAGARSLAGVMVVTSDPEARAMAEAIAGARVVPDHDPPRGMNAAVVRGLEAVAAAGADGALVLTADLPLARPEDLDAVAAAAPAAAAGPSATLAPSRDGTGTNAMLLRPPAALTPRLGVDSLARHLHQAARRGVTVARVDRPNLALDIDTPRDLAELMAGHLGRGGSGATLEACARLAIAGLLAAGSPAGGAR